MNCKNCGNELKENAKFCAACGTAVEEAITEPVTETPVTPVAPAYVPPVSQPVSIPYKEPKKEITEKDLPEHLKPISPWAYFGLTLLYSVPIVGFIFLIIFSISKGNINRRNFTRSYWCSLIIVGVILVVALVIGILVGVNVFDMRSSIPQTMY